MVQVHGRITSSDYEFEKVYPGMIGYILEEYSDGSLTDQMKRALLIVCMSSYNDYLDKYRRNTSIEAQLN